MILFYQLNTKGAFFCVCVILWDALATLCLFNESEWGKELMSSKNNQKKDLEYSTQVMCVTFNGLLCFLSFWN